jgi:hypothetical protein
MQNYELTCVKLNGDRLAAKLGEYDSLSDVFDDLENVCFLDQATGDYFRPLPSACKAWAIVSDDGMEMAAVRG